MVEVGGHPILWHILKIYASQGVKKYILCAGYKQNLIKNYFERLHLTESDVQISTATGEIKVLRPSRVDWEVSVIDTGVETQTGERLRKVRELVPDEFFMTYGDGVTDLDLSDLLTSHRQGGGDWQP